MELMISLAHFCDNHGPTSILCTQSIPTSCYSCDPSSSTDSSCENLKQIPLRCTIQNKSNTSNNNNNHIDTHLHHHPLSQTAAAANDISKSNDSFDFEDVHDSSHTNDDTHPVPASLANSSDPTTAENPQTPTPQLQDTARASDSTSTPSSSPQKTRARHHTRRPTTSAPEPGCTNCSITLPSQPSSLSTTSSTPSSSPPSSLASSPRLRSRVPVRVYNHHNTSSSTPYSSFSSHPDSVASSFSPSTSFHKHPQHAADLPYHNHTHTFLSTHTPLNPTTYSSLRRAIVRTLSGEHLPRGLTSGRLFFGNATDGFVIAYTFRLQDPYARGGGRLYSFVALTGEMGGEGGGGVMDVYGIIAPIWRHFERMADWLAGKVAKANALPLEPPDAVAGGGGGEGHADDASTGTSFLTTRNKGAGAASTSASHQVRVVGGGGTKAGGSGSGAMLDQRGRSLAEMTGDEGVFAKIHWRFVELFGSVGS